MVIYTVDRAKVHGVGGVGKSSDVDHTFRMKAFQTVTLANTQEVLKDAIPQRERLWYAITTSWM